MDSVFTAMNSLLETPLSHIARHQAMNEIANDGVR